MKHLAIELYIWLTSPIQALCSDILESVNAATEDAAYIYRPWDSW